MAPLVSPGEAPPAPDWSAAPSVSSGEPAVTLSEVIREGLDLDIREFFRQIEKDVAEAWRLQ